jgi:acyl-CoA synthetase (AMP-forming)/AMP-acid ligase II
MRVMGDVLRLNAKRYPDKIAIMTDGEELSYRELNTRCNKIANGLLSSGVRPGDRVAVFALNCLDYVAIVYAIFKCGAICVPANFRYKGNELAYVVNNAGPKTLFHDRDLAATLSSASNQFSSTPAFVSISGDAMAGGRTLSEFADGQSSDEPDVEVDPSNVAFIMYTSGTTGFPKGVLSSHHAYLQVAVGLIYEGDLRHDDVALCALPLFHNGGINAMVLPTLVVGGCCYIHRGSFEPETILGIVREYRISVTLWVPTILAKLVNDPATRKNDCSSLTKIWYGSSAINPTTMTAAKEVFKAEFYQWYGQTETGMVSVLRPEDHAERSQFTGREIYNAEIRVVDENMNDTPVGEVGEIITLQKNQGMIGYYKMPQATEKIIRNGWIHTEDLARVEGNGYFTVVDRLRDMIISGAENVYSKEIEDIIATHPAVLEVAVFGIPDETWGEVVCASVVKKEGYGQVDEKAIIGFCSSRMAGYKKPKRVEFRDELPKNAAGKVTKNVLRSPYWEGRTKRV